MYDRKLTEEGRKKNARLEKACEILNQFKLNPEGCTNWRLHYTPNDGFAISAVFNADIKEEAEKKLNEFKDGLFGRIPELSESVEEVKQGGMPVIDWASYGAIEEMPFKYGLLIKEDKIEKVLLILKLKSLGLQAYTKGASAGALSQFFTPEIGQHIGSFLDRKTGGRLASVNTAARDLAKYEENRNRENTTHKM